MVRTCTFPGCGRRTADAASRRCALHPLPPKQGTTAAHRRARTQTLAEETRCFLCGHPARPDDPLVAGHVVARAHGGPDHRSNFRAVHDSCNRVWGAAPMTRAL